MLLALIANPQSGAEDGGDSVRERLSAGGATVHPIAIDELTGQPPGVLCADGISHGVAALSEAGLPDRIVVAGGDGSIGVAARLAAELGVTLAVVPAGTANDFARALELPQEIEAACALAADPAARVRHAELAQVGDRPFVNAASAGLSVFAARAADPLKSRLGALAYAVGALRAAATASPRHCRVRCDGAECWAGEAWQVTIGATGAFGGGSEIGGTEHDDGLLDAAIVPAGSRLGLARRAWGMRTASLTAQQDVPHLRGCVIEVDLDPPTPFNVDGELCPCDPARFELLSGGFEVVAG